MSTANFYMRANPDHPASPRRPLPDALHPTDHGALPVDVLDSVGRLISAISSIT